MSRYYKFNPQKTRIRQYVPHGIITFVYLNIKRDVGYFFSRHIVDGVSFVCQNIILGNDYHWLM